MFKIPSESSDPQYKVQKYCIFKSNITHLQKDHLPKMKPIARRQKNLPSPENLTDFLENPKMLVLWTQNELAAQIWTAFKT